MLLFVWQFDPRGDKVGGIGKYILSFLNLISTSTKIGIIGVTTNSSEVGSWQLVNINGKEINFLPVCYVGNENSKPLVPMSLKFSLGFLWYRKYIPLDSVLFYQRLEYLLPSLFFKRKKYCMIHFDMFEYLDKENGESYWRKAPSVFNRLISLLIKHTDGVFSVNSRTIQYFKDNFKSYTGEVDFTPTWADNSLFNIQKELSTEDMQKLKNKFDLDKNRKVIIVIGRLNKQKNIELVLEISSKLENSVVLIVGDGVSKIELESKVLDEKLNNKIKFIGRQTPKDIKDLLHISNIYLSTSKTEGMSVALLEALSMGIPAITTPTGESKAIIIQGETGFVSTSWNRDELVGFINEVFNNPSKYERNKIVESASFWSADKTIPKILNKMGL
jgi:glycosyltransferase involved in cell wall biosynthesis